MTYSWEFGEVSQSEHTENAACERKCKRALQARESEVKKIFKYRRGKREESKLIEDRHEKRENKQKLER